MIHTSESKKKYEVNARLESLINLKNDIDDYIEECLDQYKGEDVENFVNYYISENISYLVSEVERVFNLFSEGKDTLVNDSGQKLTRQKYVDYCIRSYKEECLKNTGEEVFDMYYRPAIKKEILKAIIRDKDPDVERILRSISID